MASGGGRRRRQAKPRARAKKGKRTKYLSLSDLMVKAEVAATPTPPTPLPEDEPASPCEDSAEVEVKPKEDTGERGDGGAERQQQVEPFTLHHVHEASTLFEALPAPSLSDILGPSPSASPDGAGSSGASGRRLPGAAQEEDLARRALRGRERWVYCSSPAATATPTATTSSSSPCCSSAASTGASAAARSLLLKLDYEEILAAWADRGSLYIGAAAGSGGCGGEGGSPELQLDAVLMEVEPSEHTVAALSGSGRAERVMRYKEKRRRRLFAKRIRYEVRRVNAVKRPRFKGRFIKEHEESDLWPT